MVPDNVCLHVCTCMHLETQAAFARSFLVQPFVLAWRAVDCILVTPRCCNYTAFHGDDAAVRNEERDVVFL